MLVIGYTGAAELACNQDQFTQCQKEFAQTLNINETYNWENPSALREAIQNVYVDPSENGLVKICKAFNGLIKCLNRANLDVDTCISAKWLLHNDQKVDKAYPYAMLMKKIRWQCSAGFYPAFDNWKSISEVYTKKNAVLLSCIDNFQSNANHAAEQDICAYASRGRRCYQQAFYEVCPEIAAVKNYGCESFRQYVLAEYPQCDDFCEV